MKKSTTTSTKYFKELIDQHYCYVDKIDFIQTVLIIK